MEAAVAALTLGPPGQLRQRLEEAFKMDAPVLIEAPVGEMPDPWSSVLNLPRVRG